MMKEQEIRDMRNEYWTILDKTKNKVERERIASIILIFNVVLGEHD